MATCTCSSRDGARLSAGRSAPVASSGQPSRGASRGARSSRQPQPCPQLKVALVAPSATNDLAFTQSMYTRPREPEGAVQPEDLRLGERVRRRRRGEHHPPVRLRGLQPDHRPRLAVRQHDPAAGAPVPEGLLRLGNGGLDVRADEHLRLPGQLERGRLRPGLHGRAAEQAKVLGIIGPIDDR